MAATVCLVLAVLLLLQCYCFLIGPAHAAPCCLQGRKKTVTQCAEELPEECNALRYALFACKRGQMDARSRIQGNKGY